MAEHPAPLAYEAMPRTVRRIVREELRPVLELVSLVAAALDAKSGRRDGGNEEATPCDGQP
jgi:hypothetical protein